MLIDFEKMEPSVGTSYSNGKRPLECTKSVNEGKKQGEYNNANTAEFVNHAAITWHENRKKWIGDQSCKQKKAKDPIISWTTTYEELLSTNEPFSELIPLSEMVDFLVDIWHDEGLYD